MKFLLCNDNYFAILLLDFDKTEINNKDLLEQRFKNIFLKIKELYKIELTGLYKIKLYIDNYAAVLEITEEEADFYEYYNDEIEMCIIINENSNILFELNDTVIDYMDYYLYMGKIYGKINKKISNFEKGLLLESTINVLYGDKAKYIYKDINKYN